VTGRLRARPVAALLLAAAHVAVLVVPGALVAVTADKGGIPGLQGLDLLVTSSIVGLVAAALVWRDQGGAQRAASLADAVLARLDGLLVTALLSSGLLFVVLGASHPMARILLGDGVGLLVLWAGVQLVAVLLGEVTTRRVRRWLAR
jgi:hypothetical protein